MLNSATGVGSGEVCRLVLVGPASKVEVAVPAHVPLADLMPTLLGHLGSELPDRGHAHGGWVLQRLGEPPLAEDLGTAALGLYDGDVLYLRGRSAQLPPVDFDDLVDGVATGVAARADRWRAETTRRLVLALVGIALAGGAAAIPATGTGSLAAAAGGLLAAVLLIAATAASRAWADAAAGALLAAGAVGFAAAAGLVLPAADRAVRWGPALLTGPGVLAAGAAAAAAALLARAALGCPARGFLSAAGAGALVAAGGMLSTVAGIDRTGAAAVVLATALLLAAVVPILGARLAGLRIRPLPTSATEFQQDIDPEPSRTVLAGTESAIGYLVAMYAGLAVVEAGCLALLASAPAWSAQALTAVASFLLLLNGRDLIGTWQRLSVLGSGMSGVVAVLAARTAAQTPPHRLGTVAVLVVLACVLVVVARVLPGRRLLPYWGRLADIGQSAAALAVVPLVLAVLRLYARIRAGGA
jgi:type VII secretion integral membrane protein EccD